MFDKAECNDCGWVGDYESLNKRREYRGEFWGTPAYETWYFCPCCGGDSIHDYRGEEEDEEDYEDD